MYPNAANDPDYDAMCFIADICPNCSGHLESSDSGEPDCEPGMRCDLCHTFFSDDWISYTIEGNGDSVEPPLAN